MSWFLNLKTAGKLLVGFGLVVLLMGIVIASAMRGMDSVERSLGLALALSGFENNLNENRASMLMLLQQEDGQGRETLLAEVRAQAAESSELLERARGYALDQGTQRSIDAVAQPWREYSRIRDEQTLPLLLEGRAGDARMVSLAGQTTRYLELRQAIRALTDEVRAQARDEADQARTVFFAVGALVLVATALVVWLLSRLIATPLLEISRAAERISEGDLAVAVAAGGREDEVGVLAQSFQRMGTALQSMAATASRIADGDLSGQVQPQSERDVLGRAFASMVENLRRLIGELVEGIAVLSTSATQISTSSSQFAASASETAAAVSETTTTVEEVRQTAQVSSQKARTVSESAQRVSQISETGRQVTEEVIAGMHRIQQQMEAIAQSMVRLSEQSLAVGQIVATVEDLAAQSKVLAVNASIEAVKAGEFGKGFGVVAQEVRSLAEQSKQATAQVRGILNEIQKATSAAVLATEQGSHAVSAGLQQSQQAGQSIQALAASVSEAAQAATLIAASSQQQLVGVDQVASAMESIKLASSQNVDSARELASAARNIQELGEKLRRLSESYRL